MGGAAALTEMTLKRALQGPGDCCGDEGVNPALRGEEGDQTNASVQCISTAGPALFDGELVFAFQF